MNLERFIAKRVASSNKQSFSGLIIKIAVVAVALSLAVMIVATAVISGFKHQIGEKIFGFWGHIHITSPQINRTTGEAVPISINQNFYPYLDTIKEVSYLKNYEIFGYELPAEVEKKTNGGIKHIQVFTLKPGIIKTKTEIEGIILKGVGKDFKWSFFDKYLIEGKKLELPDSVIGKGILISQQTASRLQLAIGDKFIFNYVRDGDVLASRFVVRGIYRTGLEEYDLKFALVDIREVQRLLNWKSDEVGGFEVFIDDLDDLEIMSDYIYYEEVPANLYCESIRSKYPRNL